MSKQTIFARQRHQLDQAITYGTKKQALGLARKFLALAKKRNIVSEIEYFKGQIDLLKNRFVSAIEHFDLALKLNPKDGASYNDRALCMVELGIIDEALEYFDKGIAAEPDYATIYHNKGWLLNNIGRYTEAIKCFNKALELEPDRAVTYDNLADALANLGEIEAAIRAYRKVLELLKPNQCRIIRSKIKERIKELQEKIYR
ncbi:MAG: tetratricopeptide repeat protein [Candidatus Omnitrophica bacterium]|nr:tetratricopeptide repeat protein [Candidatus Omnitrophota bacterium]